MMTILDWREEWCGNMIPLSNTMLTASAGHVQEFFVGEVRVQIFADHEKQCADAVDGHWDGREHGFTENTADNWTSWTVISYLSQETSGRSA